MKFALYYYDSCPYCQRVLMALPNLKVNVEKRNVQKEPKWRAEQAEATGRTQVPCLKITKDDGSDAWLFESADIIRFLQNQ